MAKLSYGERERMPRQDFALPRKRNGGKGGYPIEDATHARDALARVAQHGTEAEREEVRSKVHKKFPSIGKKNKKSKGHFRDMARKVMAPEEGGY